MSERDVGGLTGRLRRAAELSGLRAYGESRTIVRSGERLWEWRDEDIDRAGLQRPLAFNLAESWFVGLSALALIAAIGWALSDAERISVALDVTASMSGSGGEEAVGTGLRGRVRAMLWSLAMPFALLAHAWIAAAASLNVGDLTRERLRNARRAYLYIDGAYGTLFQFLLAVGVGVIVLAEGIDRQLQSWGVIAVVIGAVGVMRMQLSTMPKRLFEANGYSGERRRWTYVVGFLFLASWVTSLVGGVVDAVVALVFGSPAG